MPKTYNDILIDIRGKLRAAGIEDFSFEAKVLTAVASEKTKEQLMRDLMFFSSPAIEKKANAMLERRLKGEPLAYISGEWEFMGLPMFVSPDVLIPRIDTEVLATAAIDAARSNYGSSRVLDLCCGSGCIACAISRQMPNAKIVAADLSPNALDIARKNISRNGLSSRIITINADALAWPPMSIGSFDIIVSNPPYICSSEIAALDPSVRDYEPHTALDGGEDGLMFYRAIIQRWKSTLRPNGYMMFEVGEGQAAAVQEMLLENEFVSVAALKDTIGVDRVVIGKWKNEI